MYKHGDMPNSTESNKLFEYKQKFDQSYLNVGICRPEMGGIHWNQMDIDSSQNMDSLDIVSLSQKPLKDFLHVPGLKERNAFAKPFHYLYFMLSKSMDHYYPSIPYIKQKVLTDERVHHAIQKTMCISDQSCSLDDNDVKRDVVLEQQLGARAARIIDEMIATVTSPALRFCGWLFVTMLRQLTSAVHLHQGQLEVLRQLSSEDKPLIYLPLHFSHFDYILISSILYHTEIRAPYVATGNNLNIPLFRSVMRRVGGFFIRRKIDKGNEKDHIYRAILNVYVTQLLKENQSLEVFIEGTRTRSGLPNQPKTGIFSVAVEAVLKGEISDVNIVPVCCSYEKLLEGNFNEELMGQSKTPETFLMSLYTIFKMVCGFYGHIRVNFGAPQSLKKAIQEIRSSPSCSLPAQSSILPRSKSLYEQVTLTSNNSVFMTKGKRSNSSPSVDYPLTGVINSASGPHRHKTSKPSSSQILEDSKQYQDDRELITLLAERMIYRGIQCKAFMSTNLVAFLLLHNFRNGVTMPTLVRHFRQLVTDLLTRKSDVGFTGDFSEIVLHAVNILGSNLVTLDCSHSKEVVFRLKSSQTSMKSRHSADSGLDVDDQLTSSPASTPSVKSAQHLSPAGSDCELKVDDVHDVPTGVFMKMSESGVYDASSFDELPTSESEDSSIDDIYSGLLSKQRRSKSKSNLCLFVQPNLAIPQVFELAYYSNALTPTFALESLAALAVGAVTGYRFSTLEKQIQQIRAKSKGQFLHLDSDDLPQCARSSFLRSSLAERTLELADLLQMDLLMCDVTTSLDEAVNEAIESLISSGCLSSDQYGVSNAIRTSDTARDLCFDADDVNCFSDVWLKINMMSVEQLIAKQSVMACHVEGYVAASSYLHKMIDCDIPVPEWDLKQQMTATSQSRVHKNVSVRAESCSSDIIMNAIRSFEWNNVLVRCGPNNKSLKLMSDFDDSESIINLVSRISQFLF